MASLICQNCNKSNPDTLEICQFCGTPLKKRGTDPLPTIHPGEVPVKHDTSELESTLPGWLRDMRKGGDDGQDDASATLSSISQPAKPSVPSKPAASPLDFLAGLSQLDDDEEAEPDWLSSLKGTAPVDPASKPQAQAPVDWVSGLTGDSTPAPNATIQPKSDEPVDWLAGFQTDSQPKTIQPETPAAADWGGFNDLAEEPDQPATHLTEETPDWLSALKAQDTSVNVPARPSSEDFEEADLSSGNFPDWLSNLGGDSAPAAPTFDSFSSSSFTDTSSTSASSADDHDESDLSGWLDQGMTSSAAEPAADQAGESLDWLANLGGETAPTPQKSQPASPVQDSSSETQFPDWLSNLGGSSTSTPQKPEPVQDASSTGGSLDWLSSLGGDSTPAPQKPEPAQDTSFAGESLDWLSNLGGDSTPTPQKPEPAQDTSSGGASLDWLSNLGDVSIPAPQKPEPAQDTSSGGEPLDWLSNLGSDSTPAPQKPEPVQDISSGGESLDWLSNLGGDSTPASQIPEPVQDTSSGGDSLDWLSNLGSDSTPAPQKPEPAQDSSSSGESLDWLSNLGDVSTPATQKPEPASMTAQDSSADGDFPDWLSNLGGQSAPAQDLPVSSMDASSDAQFPDWLDNLGGNTPEAESQAEPMGSQDTFVNDWGADLSSEAPTPSAVETPSTDSSSIFSNLLVNDDIGWLEPAAQDKKPAPASEEPPIPVQKAFSTGSLEGILPLKKADDVPDWLSNLNATTQKKAAEPDFSSDFSSTEGLDWLSSADVAESNPTMAESQPKGMFESAENKPKAPAELPTSAFIPDASQNLDSIFSMEMPDWLSGFTPAEPAASEELVANEQPVDENLSSADLPSWVQAMRPIDSVGGGAQVSADDQVVEQVGPLAGFRSVLPGLENALPVRKPKAYSIKLQVDSTQLAQATLLENLIASEAESRPVVTGQRVVNFRSLRWVVAAVLLVVTLGAGIMGLGGRLFPLPSLPNSGSANPEVSAFYDHVEGLPDAAKVLVVFDYQPGYAGEMEQAAGPVIDHLMRKKAIMAFVSTLPTGVLMNERMMAMTDKNQDLTVAKSYIDLGYLPGDAAGIQVFAENPDVLGYDYQAGYLWKGITGNERGNQLSDFDLAIVLTDNPDTGRVWIEQAGSALQTGLSSVEKPMLMVVSAQAAPMIFPYYVSGQIKGLVSGLAGGVLYQTASGEPKTAAGIYWDAYGAGMMAAELLIVIGAIWALIQRVRMRRAEQNQNEEDEE